MNIIQFNKTKQNTNLGGSLNSAGHLDVGALLVCGVRAGVVGVAHKLHQLRLLLSDAVIRW